MSVMDDLTEAEAPEGQDPPSASPSSPDPLNPTPAAGANLPEAQGSPVQVDATLAPKVSFATHQNAVPVLRDLRIFNDGSELVEGVVAEMECDPPVFAPRSWRLDRLGPQSSLRPADLDVALNAGLLMSLSEAVRARATVRVKRGEEVLHERQHALELLARNEWGGAVAMPELLAAFVQPNDPGVSRVLKAASEVLRRAGKPDGLNGYQSGTRARSFELASAIWSAIAGLGLTYAEPPASFETHGQKVRSPSQVLESGLATCLDTALLFAASLEQAGLYPVLVLTQGHSFAGVWLQPQEFASLLTDEAASLRKRVTLQELVVFETTFAAQRGGVPFSRAIAEGNRLISEEREREFVMALDVRRARMQRLRPLALIEASAAVAGDDAADPEEAAASASFEEAPPLPDFDLVDPISDPTTAEGRLERWQRKLLDLTTRNRLLSVKYGSSALRLHCPNPAALEDRLADGAKFKIVPAPELEGGAGRDADLHRARTGELLDQAYAAEALERGELISPLEKDKLEAVLVELYRKARADLAEGGANTLFLALGFLSWRKSQTDARSYRAPLILQPVKLERGSVRSGVRLSLHEDEPRFNLTLLQMLRQDFDLDIPELAQGLPADESGIDVPRVWNLVRRAVRDTPGFEVVEEVALGSFSFAKYLMWKDLVDRTEALKTNPIVRHLLETPKDPYETDCLPPRAEDLDQEVGPADLFTPLPADSSQLAAVVGSARGCDFVLDGPPGTGKSQTIANMIAHNLALGRKVLFVAEKRAALDVVHRRLVQHGLGPFCLELHSNKAAKLDVLRQLDSAWTAAEENPAEEWPRKAEELKKRRDLLNGYVAALHKRRPNGMTLHQAIGRVVRDGGDQLIRLDWPNTTSHSAEQLEQLKEAARRLDLTRPLDAPGAFGMVGRTEWSNAWQAELVTAAGALAAAAAKARVVREALLDRLKVELAADAHALSGLVELARALEGAAGLDLAFAFAPDAPMVIDRTRAAMAELATYRELESALSVRYAPEAARTLPLDDLAARWTKAEATFWPLSIFAKGAVIKAISPAGSKADPAADLPRLRTMRDHLRKLDALAGDAGRASGWSGLTTDTTRLERTLQAAVALRSSLARAADDAEQAARLRAAVRSLVVDANELLAADGAVGRAAHGWIEAYGSFEAALATFEATAASPAAPQAEDLLTAIIQACEEIQARQAQLNGWCAWRRAEQNATDLGLQRLIAALAEGVLAPGQASEAFEVAYSRWWAEQQIDAEPALRDFNLAEHGDAIERFRELDEEFATLTRRYIRARLCAVVPPKDAQKQPPGFGFLAHQLKLQKRHKPVRQLVQEMGPALTTLAPCLLMSPLSVAQYLPADLGLFDLVIFDEASQITPWDAVGAIARGRQLVVAGDPKQMPPTSFFDRAASVDADDTEVEEDQESILEECLGARLPQRRLTWHYRSRHESLIAFSNHRYYDGDLVTFPAPVTRDSAVSLVPVQGAWSRGKLRTNQAEAEAIVAEVIKRLTDPTFVDEAGQPLSLAVVTLNSEQQKLIEDLLDKARQKRPELERFFAEDALEPVVVKNLETVQGDERDLVLLGIGFGPETPGAPSMPMNFGPLNRGGGWRRLNVAVTRARREMMIFASFPPHMVDLNRTAAEAVRDLKHYLEFAERGPRALGEAVAGSVGGFESPFEQAVARGLRDRGWTVVPQIGVSRFRIDLGVVNPDRPGDYLCGVECDGAAYHSAATARDRDKVREAVLKSLGWDLLRVWSTDWWIDQRGALDRLDHLLREKLVAFRARVAAEPPPLPSTAPEPVDADDGSEEDGAFGEDSADDASTLTAEPLGGSYARTRLDEFNPKRELFHEPDYTPVLRSMIAKVIEQEAPIRDDLLVERIARAHGIGRSGRVVRERVLSVARRTVHLQREDTGAVFAWPDASSPGRWETVRAPATTADIRQIEEIALEELTAALRSCAGEDREVEVARLFGVRRLSSAARARLRAAAPAQGHFD